MSHCIVIVLIDMSVGLALKMLCRRVDLRAGLLRVTVKHHMAEDKGRLSSAPLSPEKVEAGMQAMNQTNIEDGCEFTFLYTRKKKH